MPRLRSPCSTRDTVERESDPCCLRFAPSLLRAGLPSAPVLADGELRAIRPAEIVWKVIRKDPPPARAFIQGDQEQSGAITVRARAAAGHKLLPHTHPDERTITVLEGT